MCASTWASTDAAPATHDALAPVPPDAPACPAPVGTHSHAGAADATPPVPHDIPATTATTTRPRILRPFRSGTDAVRSTAGTFSRHAPLRQRRGKAATLSSQTGAPLEHLARHPLGVVRKRDDIRPKSLPPLDLAIARVAERQGGVISAAQLEALGLGRRG